MMTEVVSKFSAGERETHLYRGSNTEGALVYCDTTIMSDYNACLRQGWTLTKNYVYKDGTVVGGTFEAPRNAITIRRVVSE